MPNLRRARGLVRFRGWPNCTRQERATPMRRGSTRTGIAGPHQREPGIPAFNSFEVFEVFGWKQVSPDLVLQRNQTLINLGLLILEPKSEKVGWKGMMNIILLVSRCHLWSALIRQQNNHNLTFPYQKEKKHRLPLCFFIEIAQWHTDANLPLSVIQPSFAISIQRIFSWNLHILRFMKPI